MYIKVFLYGSLLAKSPINTQCVLRIPSLKVYTETVGSQEIANLFFKSLTIYLKMTQLTSPEEWYGRETSVLKEHYNTFFRF